MFFFLTPESWSPPSEAGRGRTASTIEFRRRQRSLRLLPHHRAVQAFSLPHSRDTNYPVPQARLASHCS